MAEDLLDSLQKHIQSRVALSPAEMEEMVSCFSEKRIVKKQYIIQPEFVARHRNYVVKGSFRAYVIDHKGDEHTVQFAIEDWWITDYNSYIFQQPATMFVTALEDSIILQIDFERERRLKRANHQFETFFRITAERTAAFQQRRVISSLTQSAEERYRDFTEKYPLVVQRLPQFVLASYLGMTTEFLSKIRNNRVKKS